MSDDKIPPRNVFTNLYSGLNSQSGSKKKDDKQSPFKKAGDYFKQRLRNMSGSGDFLDGSDHSEGQIFQESDLVDAQGVTQERFYTQQINDTYGK